MAKVAATNTPTLQKLYPDAFWPKLVVEIGPKNPLQEASASNPYHFWAKGVAPFFNAANGQYMVQSFISTDFAIPVIAAISRHKTSQQFCFGFGCHIDPVIACQRALTELCQIIEIRHRNTAPFDFTAIAASPYLFPNGQLAVRTLAQLPQVWHDDIRDDILHCLEQARRLGLEVLVLNYTRPDMVLATAKVIVPGACHLFPYFAASRLYHVPVAMGLLDQPKTEDQMNPQAILI